MKSTNHGRIGIVVDHCGGTLSSLLDEDMIQYMAGLPQVTSCHEDEDLVSSKGLEKLKDQWEESGIDRVVIVGASPKVYEASFRRIHETGSLNPYMVLVANVREQGLWAISNRENAKTKAKAVVARTVERARCLQPIGREKTDLSAHVVVIGDGVVGMRVALGLADAGIRVTVVTSSEDIGEDPIELAHFHQGPADLRACWGEMVERVKSHPGLELRTSVALRRFDGHLGDFRLMIQTPGGPAETIQTSAVILATGYDVVPQREAIFESPRFVPISRVASMTETDQQGLVNGENRAFRTVVFVLDLVNEVFGIDSANAIKHAISFRRDHDCSVCVLCRDVKVLLEGMEAQYRRARELGVIFIKYDEPPRFSLVDSRVNVEVKEVSARMRGDEYTLSISSDLVFLNERFLPSKKAEIAAEVLGIPLDPGGYAMVDNPQFAGVRASRRGVFVVGGCRYPRPMEEALIEADAAVSEVMQLVSRKEFEYDLAVAEVDPEKCSLCLTCVRVCPHSAMMIDRYAEKNVYATDGDGKEVTRPAARVVPIQCYGCGICVSSCPTKAIDLKHQSDHEISVHLTA
jgi:heterodisulfide reductase subunit A-like polyferredoxin